jgi:beta-galactosidase
MNNRSLSQLFKLPAPLKLALSLVVLLAGPAHGHAVPPRLLTPLLSGWQFTLDSPLTQAVAGAGEGTGWRPVSVPHSWNTGDAASVADTSPASQPYRRSVGWYRLEFDHAGTGGSQWLQFDGASIVADVWLNGVELGRHQGAFSAFRFDVGSVLHRGRNVLVVKVDNRPPLTGTDPTAIAPLSGDFNMSGGLYRPVTLVATAARSHIALDDMGSSGVYFSTDAVAKDGSATVAVRARWHDGGEDGPLALAVKLQDARGRVVARARSAAGTGPGDAREGSVAMKLRHAQLWQGVVRPYLYRLTVQLRNRAGRVIDQVEQDVGVRQMRFDPAAGFLLNGVPTRLRGVSLHQDFQDKGWVLGQTEVDASLALVKEMGANSVRLAHYPHAGYTLRQADKLGLVVWAEVPFIERSLTAGDCKAGAAVPESFISNLVQQTRELIRQQYNHASIAMWSIANEVGMGGRCQGVDTVTPLLRQMHALAKAEDATRVTTLADFNEDMAIMRPMFEPMSSGGITDIWAVNRYPMWYYPMSASAIEAMYDALHAKYPLQPLGVSEYGAGAALTHQTDDPLGGVVANFDMHGRARMLFQPEGYANHVHEQNYGAMAGRAYLWGSYVWNMFDFGSGIRHEGDIGGTNTKGLVTFDRKTRKDPFYFYKANWSSSPVTYITGRRYTERAYPQTDVRVYSNAGSVSLEVNGRHHATLQASDCPLRVCVFPAVRLQQGGNRLVARGRHPGGELTDSVDWSLSADNASNFYLVAGQPATGFTSADGHRHGSDAFFTGGQGAPLEPDGTYGERFNTAVSNVADARDRQLWSTIRYGTFSYTIPLHDGRYQVTLGMLEPRRDAVVGSRIFDIVADGVTQVEALDIVAAAGAHGRALTRSFMVDVHEGRLLLEFKPRAGQAVLSNLRIERR